MESRVLAFLVASLFSDVQTRKTATILNHYTSILGFTLTPTLTLGS
jgi:hypothetical protein